MEYPNNERILVRIIKELSEELDFQADFLSYDWIIRIIKDQRHKYIIGYDWEINNASAQIIAKDKNATYEILNSQGIPAIEHRLYLSPSFQNYIGKNGNWHDMIDYAQKHDFQIVCKANTGTGGNDVFKITNRSELESCVHALFMVHRGISLCPFYDIDHEYRVVILNGIVQLTYSKQKPYVIGNGKDTVAELIKNSISSFKADLSDIDVFQVLDQGEILELEWKHNLAKGAIPVLVEDNALQENLAHLAKQAARAININFASVDIVEYDGKFFVMEINSGVMMESFARHKADFYTLTKDVYKNALAEMLSHKKAN